MIRINTLVLLLLTTIQTSQNPPGPRHLEEIAFDSERNILLVSGGGEIKIGSGTIFPDQMSEWNGKTWTNAEVPGPKNRYGHALVYDPNERATFLISGVNQSDRKVASDVWKWNGELWKQINTNCPVKTAEAVYDPNNKRVLAYGDTYNIKELRNNSDPLQFELWEFKNNAWKKLSAEGPQISSQFEIAFDINRNALIIPAWENGYSILWEWKDEKWNKIICKEKFPEDRNRYALAYHPKEKTTFLFAGRNDANPFLNDFWKWDGTSWTKIISNRGPSTRAAAVMEFGNNGIYVYGGVVEWGLSNEIWKWQDGKWKLLNSGYAMTEERTAFELKQWLSNHPGDVESLLMYGTLLGKQKKYDEALSQLEKARVIAPSDHNILINLCAILYEQKKDDEATNKVIEAVNTSSMSRDSFSRLANYFYSVKRYQESAICFQKIIQLLPDGGDYYNLACCFALLSDKDKAFESLQKAIALGFNSKQQFENDPDLQTLKSDMRWKELVSRLK